MPENKEEQCPSPLEIIIIGRCEQKARSIIFNPDCAYWDCPYCGPKKMDQWRHVGFRGAAMLAFEGYELRFVTLTSRANATVVTGLRWFKENWPKLNRRIKYHTEKELWSKWAYFLVPEQHKTGVLHVHMVCSTHLRERWFKDNAVSCGFGYMAKSKPIAEPAMTTSYLTKYLTKTMQFSGWPKGFRRARVSRNWPKEIKPEMPGWVWQKHSDKSAWYEKGAMLDMGWSVDDKRLEPQ